MQPPVVFSVPEQDEAAVEVRVNFGVFAGRQVTPAEIDELARALGDVVPFSIVAEDRHEFADAVEATVHQVVIQVAREDVLGDTPELRRRIVGTAELWAEACIADRSAEIG